MSAPCQSACGPWITFDQVAACCSVADDDLLDTAAARATDLLYELSGRRFPGTCLDVVQICLPCGCGGTCGCAPSERMMLPSDPVVDLIEVRDAEGVVQSLDNYRIEDHRYLVRTDGEHWPRHADLTDPNAFKVSYAYGASPPPAGVAAAIELACELAKACDDDSTCTLPSRVRDITRQGMSMTLLDPQEFLADGRTGLYTVDLFLSAYNPAGLRSRGSVWSPDLPQARRVTT